MTRTAASILIAGSGGLPVGRLRGKALILRLTALGLRRLRLELTRSSSISSRTAL
jgi:hypothetical protein